jgi:hypothetical protein
MLKKVAVGVNHHQIRGMEFSTGDLGNFHPALTRARLPVRSPGNDLLPGVPMPSKIERNQE